MHNAAAHALIEYPLTPCLSPKAEKLTHGSPIHAVRARFRVQPLLFWECRKHGALSLIWLPWAARRRPRCEPYELWTHVGNVGATQGNMGPSHRGEQPERSSFNGPFGHGHWVHLQTQMFGIYMIWECHFERRSSTCIDRVSLPSCIRGRVAT